MAVNNGPDIPPGVEVTLTGVPRGAEVIASEGTYRNGVWYIDDLSSGEAHRASGHRTDGPTLTVIAESEAPVSASIAAVGEYCVRIKTGATNPVNDLECTGALPEGYTEHTAEYYDYNDENSTDVEIAARAGTGSYPGAPRSLTAVETPVGNVLWWEPVGRVYGHPVTHYEVQRREEHGWVSAASRVRGTTHRDEYFGDAMPRYRVRAVNWMGVPGPWSQPTEEGRERAQPPDPVRPPDPVTGLTAAAGDGFVDLEWRAVRSGGEEIVWQLWRADDPDHWWDVHPRVLGSSRLGYTVTELDNGTEYVFRVRAATLSEYGELVPGVSSGTVLATPTAAQGRQSPPEETTDESQDDGPNHPPEFDRDAAWYPETPWCASAGARPGTEVARVSAYDPDGDSLDYYQVTGFDDNADAYFTVRTVRNGDAYEGVVRVSRAIPRDLEVYEGYINVDLEVNDGRGGIDQIGVALQYDPSGGSCR